ncbi:MAG: YlxR family protein [Fimbriimonadales bacterium]|nr:YlxR family protein [Fimbriimonadales bacterium]
MPEPRKRSPRSPIRRCAACRRAAPKSELIRFARDPQTLQVLWDPEQKLPGRGAYLCPNPACFRLALKRHSLDRALKAKVEERVLREAQHATETPNPSP